MANTANLDWADLLRFEQEQGQIFLKDYRMVLLSAYALGALRQDRRQPRTGCFVAGH